MIILCSTGCTITGRRTTEYRKRQNFVERLFLVFSLYYIYRSKSYQIRLLTQLFQLIIFLPNLIINLTIPVNNANI